MAAAAVRYCVHIVQGQKRLGDSRDNWGRSGPGVPIEVASKSPRQEDISHGSSPLSSKKALDGNMSRPGLRLRQTISFIQVECSLAALASELLEARARGPYLPAVRHLPTNVECQFEKRRSRCIEQRTCRCCRYPLFRHLLCWSQTTLRLEIERSSVNSSCRMV